MNPRYRLPLLIGSGFLVVILCLAGFIAAANFIFRLAENRTFPITVNDFPRIDSSTSAEPIANLIACRTTHVKCAWTDSEQGQRLLPTSTAANIPWPESTGTHSAYMNLIEGKADLIIVARAPSEDELSQAAQAGIQLNPQPIALDAFVFIANKKNPVDGLTQTQIHDIYTGKITNWKTVGGKDEPIKAFQRNQNSGSQELMDSLVLKGDQPIEALEAVDSTMIGSFLNVNGSPNGIAYSVFYYEENMVRWPNVKLLAVDRIEPSQGSIRNGKYPFATNVYAVVRSDLEPTSSTAKLLRWLQTADGQRLVQESGYVTLNR